MIYLIKRPTFEAVRYVTCPVALESFVMVTAMPGFDNHGLKAYNTTQHHTYRYAALSYSKQHG